MPVNQPSRTANPSIQGDQATRRFAIFFLSALAVITIGAGVGIGVGNIAHYRYFGPNNLTNLTDDQYFNETFRAAPLVLPSTTHLKKRESLRLWEVPPNEDEYDRH